MTKAIDMRGVMSASAIRVGLMVKDDAGNYVNLNEPGSTGYPNYNGSLMQMPSVSFLPEKSGGIYVSSSDQLIMDNRALYDTDDDGNLIHGQRFGFWDAPFPVQIRKTATNPNGHRFSAWYRRTVKIWVFQDEAGVEQGASILGTFRIDNVDRNENVATITLVSLHKLLMDRSAADIKFGTDWYKGAPINFLVKMLVKAADPDMAICSELETETVDLGIFSGPVTGIPERRSSSWSKVPGWSEEGIPFAAHHIVRCQSKHGDYLYVGVEVPDREVAALSSGSIYRFNVVTGGWKLLYSRPGMWTPRSIKYVQAGDGTDYLHIMWGQEAAPNEYWWGFYLYQIAKLNLSNYIHSTGSTYQAWDTRFVVRKGRQGGSYDQVIGGIKDFYETTHPWFGESMVLAFPQCIDVLVDLMYPATVDTVGENMAPNSLCWWHGYKQITNQLFNHAAESKSGQQALPMNETDSVGMYAGYCLPTPYYYPACFRYSLNYHTIHPLWIYYRRDDGIGNFNDRYGWFYLRNGNPGEDEWKFVFLRPYDYQAFWWITQWADDSFWLHQITAFCLLPGQNLVANTYFWLLVAEVRWLEEFSDQSDDAPFAEIALMQYKLTKNTEGLPASVQLELWSYKPEDCETIPGYSYTRNDWAGIIVDMFQPETTGTDGRTRESYFVALILNRGDVSGPCYGIGVFSHLLNNPIYGGIRWIQAHAIPYWPDVSGLFPFEHYAGPRSGRPFSGWVQDPDDSRKVYFTDEATGKLHSLTVNDDEVPIGGASHLVWGVENRGMSLHASEHAQSSRLGEVCDDCSDGHDRYFFGMAPGPPGEMAMGHPLRPKKLYRDGGVEAFYAPKLAHQRWQPGSLYPLVMWSEKCAHIVEVADFTGLSCWEALSLLRELAWDYYLYISRNGTLQFVKRGSGADYLFDLRSSAGTADPMASTPAFLIEGANWREVDDDIINAVEGTPHSIASAGRPSVDVVPAAGSTFSGRYEVKVHSKAPFHLSLLCVSGGDIYTGSRLPGASGENFVLFAWRYVLPRIRGILVSPTTESTTTIDVCMGHGKLPTAAFGDDRILSGDLGHIRIQGSEWVEINTIWLDADLPDRLRVSLNGQAGIAASVYAEVEIWLRDGMGQSDDPAGLATLAPEPGVTIDKDDVMVPVSDSRPFRRGMILEVKNEKMEVEEVWGQLEDRCWVKVRRGLGGTAAEDYTEELPIKGYVHLSYPNQMYVVGDTGISFGAYIDTDQEAVTTAKKKQRTISEGDSVVIITKGLELQEMDQAVVRVEDPTSIGLYKRVDYALDNRFLDMVKADLTCNKIVAEEAMPKTEVKGTTDLIISLDVGDLAGIFNRRIVPTGSTESFRVEGLTFALEARKVALTIRSIETFAGAVAPIPPPPPRPIKRGSRDAVAAPPPQE